MRVLANTEAAARKLLNDMVQAGTMTQADADRLFRWGFRIVTQTIANWRRREATPEMINEQINRRIHVARTRIAQARTNNERNLGARDMILAQMFQVVWKGMQRDVAAYQNR